MKVVLDQNSIEVINLFQNLTDATVIDSISEDGEIYFVVAEGQYGLAVGKGGMKIKHAENVFKKTIKVLEYSEDMETFIKNIIPEAQEITINSKLIFVKVRPADRARVIGKNGKNIRIINKFLQRLFDIEELKVK
ncbi:MAG: NusA-like transcription termination signal-binding factor [Candidatus Aenigmarchaeota archaeon]|nr:NusA-like transcription termination signal-binding factor [Candidatus Aenigmarchaeota archaeon]